MRLGRPETTLRDEIKKQKIKEEGDCLETPLGGGGGGGGGGGVVTLVLTTRNKTGLHTF